MDNMDNDTHTSNIASDLGEAQKHKVNKRWSGSSMNSENCLLGPNFGETDLMKNYPDLLKIWNIDGADK